MKDLCSLQIKLARVGLGWTIDKLADLSGLSWVNIQNIEKNDDYFDRKKDHAKILFNLFNDHNVEFCYEEDYEPFVKIKKK